MNSTEIEESKQENFFGVTNNKLSVITLSQTEKLKNSIFEFPITPQTLNINN